MDSTQVQTGDPEASGGFTSLPTLIGPKLSNNDIDTESKIGGQPVSEHELVDHI